MKYAFADATPDKIRKSMVIYGSSMWIFIAVYSGAIYFNRIPDMKLHLLTMGNTTYSSSDIAFMSGLNYLVFLTVWMVNTIRYPLSFALIKSSMKSIKLDPEIAEKSVRSVSEMNNSANHSF